MSKNRLFTAVIFQSLLLMPTSASSQILLKQKNISKAGIEPGNYSGITHIRDNLYIVVDDKDRNAPFAYFEINIDGKTGKVTTVKKNTLKTSTKRHFETDAEDVAYNKHTNTVFITSESEQTIKEYTLEGIPTGRELAIPLQFSKDKIQHNRGFETLSFNSTDSLFWTTTESELNKDKTPNMSNGKKLRIQTFGYDLEPLKQYAYLTDKPSSKSKGKEYAHGVPSILVLSDGRVIVLEREIKVSNYYLGSYVKHKLFIVTPKNHTDCTDITTLNTLKQEDFLSKKELCRFTTRLRLGKMNLANYEGICLGPKLDDGRQTILLINDSQSRRGNALYRLKDYIKTIILPKDF